VIGRAFALLVAGPFRFLVVALAVAACVAAYLTLPAVSESEGQPLGVAAANSKALAAEQRAVEHFGFPFVSELVIVQRDPNGMSDAAQRRAIDRAARIDRGEDKSRYPGIVAAIPIVNGAPLFQGSRENKTTIVTLLQLDPKLGLYSQYQLARKYAREQINQPDDHLVGVTGAIPARAAQGDLIDRALPVVEFVSVAVIFLLITIRFRAPGAGLLTLLAAGVAYFLSSHIVAWAALHYGLGIPIELAPLLVVLVLAVTTDYTVFLLAGAKAELARGEKPSVASWVATAAYSPIILIAALTVAGSAASLAVANLEFLRVLGPALGLSVIVSALVALTVVPAAISSFGRWILWPGLRWEAHAMPAGADGGGVGLIRRGVAHLQSIRLVAFGLTGLAFLALLFAASGLTRLHAGISIIDDLPASATESRAAQDAARGFAAGIISPSEVVIEGQGIGNQRAQLARLEQAVAREPGVAAVLGPREQLPGVPDGLFVAKDANAARVVIVFRDDPYSARAIASIRQIDKDLPRLLRDAGVTGGTGSVAGDTAAGAETIDALRSSIVPVAVLIGVVELALMALLLRALVAPLYLLVASALAAAAPLGLMAYLFTWLGHPDVSYYVPIGAAVLMVSLGADYNLFLVGRIWDELGERSVGGAVRAAAPRAASSIATAALALSLSFASLALVPLVSFRAFAFAMGAGALIDSYLVRGQLVPAMVTLFGRVGAWPGAAYRAAKRSRYRVA
jgi:putative drug exporter of the RND superfamily